MASGTIAITAGLAWKKAKEAFVENNPNAQEFKDKAREIFKQQYGMSFDKARNDAKSLAENAGIDFDNSDAYKEVISNIKTIHENVKEGAKNLGTRENLIIGAGAISMAIIAALTLNARRNHEAEIVALKAAEDAEIAAEQNSNYVKPATDGLKANSLGVELNGKNVEQQAQPSRSGRN